VVWIAYPAWRWVCVAASAAVAAGLVGMNYHFTSDVIAGLLVGGIVGAYTAYLCGLGGLAREQKPETIGPERPRL
jgi:membrane-associated phospholipid phosphatase